MLKHSNGIETKSKI